ncbi:hypothetical protein ABPG75_003700 [Micractinium tetrahymenae]
MTRPPGAGAAAAQPPPPPPPALLTALRGVMSTHWGHDQFRPLQAEAVASTLAGRDVVVILPTGGGKSLAFQLAPLYRNQITAVVTPLLALAKDQVNSCLERGIEAASWSSDTPENVKAMLSRELLADPEDTTLRLLYTTPESLQMERLRELLKTAHEYGKLCSLAIDEAHCVSEWGHDFRPSYLTLGELRADFPGLPIIAATATATASVKQSICSLLKLREPVVLHGSFNRPNIEYMVRYKELVGDGSRDAVLQDLLAFLAERRGQCGIIYARLRATCDWLAKEIENAEVVEVAAYHAGKDAEQRSRIQQGWSEGAYDCVVATVAFGMGIDKSSVRYVVHFDPPASLEGFYQESGRGGRDGEACLSLLYASNQELRDARKMERGARQGAVGSVAAYIQEPRCRRRALLSYFGEKRTGGCQEGAGEQVCDFCRNPRAVLGQLAALERSLERSAAAEAAEAAGGDPFERCDAGSGAEEGTEQQQQQQAKRQRGRAATPVCSDGDCADSAAATASDPFASARTLAQRSAAVAAGAGARVGPGGVAPPSAPHPAAAHRVPRPLVPVGAAAAAAAAAAAGPPGGARQPLKPILPNRLKHPAGLPGPDAKQQQQQCKAALAAGGPRPAGAAPSSPTAAAGPAGAANPAGGMAGQAALPASAPAALGGLASRTGGAAAAAAAAAAAGGGGGGKKPVFKAFKAPRRLAPP